MLGSVDQARPLGALSIPTSSIDMVLTERGLEIDLQANHIIRYSSRQSRSISHSLGF